MPAIKKPNLHFDATLYTGTGSALSVTNAGGFQPDFVWIKERDAVEDHFLFDSVRGATKFIRSNTTDAEGTLANYLTAFNSNGFSLGDGGGVNGASDLYVAWNWKAGGTAVTNTAGSITSQVSANPTAGFSIVTYTGNGTIGATVGHGLGVAPSMFIVKQKSASGESWATYHISLGATKYLDLNGTGAAATSISRWNNTAPTSSVFSLYNDSATNGNSSTYVAYCFAQVAGYSAFGSYTGNGSADGPFQYLGFKPAFIMLKNATTSATNWQINDSARDTYNVMDKRLAPSTSDAEATGYNFGDFLSNGFKIRQTDQTWNKSNDTYIYMAFAESPFKFSTAR